MKELGITKGEWVGVDYAGHYSLQVAPFYGARDLLDEDKTNEAEANMQLCCDAGNTAQKCGLLPSDLLQQRDRCLMTLNNCRETIEMLQREIPGEQIVLRHEMASRLNDIEAAIKKTESSQKTEGGGE